MIDIELLKSRCLIEEIVPELTGYELVKSGRGYMTPRPGTGEGGLVVNLAKQTYYWNSRAEGGDVISFVERFQGVDFNAALRWLAEKAGVDLAIMDSSQRAALQESRRRAAFFDMCAKYFSQALHATPQALAWARRRGFTDDTLHKERCGYCGPNLTALREYLKVNGADLTSEAAAAIFALPSSPEGAGWIVYAHVAPAGGHVEYFSFRSCAGKKHYNLEARWAGPKRPYFNNSYNARANHVVIVEGQADAITLAQWDLPAVALAGAAADMPLLDRLKKHKSVYVALDQDATGDSAVARLAAELGPLTKIATWPAHDANEWLQQNATAEQARALLGAATPYALWAARRVAEVDPLDREQARRDVYALAARLTRADYAVLRKNVAAALELRVTDLDQVTRALKEAPRQNGRHKEVRVMLGGYVENHLFEACYSNDVGGCPGGGPLRFAVRRPDGQIETVERLEFEEFEIAPPPHDKFTAYPSPLIALSPPPEPYQSEEALINQIRKFISAYVDLPSVQFLEISTFYAAYTWHYDRFPRALYLRRVGDRGGGKSRWLETLAAMCWRPYVTTGATSLSPLFRNLDLYKPILLIDELNLSSDNNRSLSERESDLYSILNAGYASTLGRLERSQYNAADSTHESQTFRVYGPKVFTSRQIFADDGLESRIISDFVPAAGRIAPHIPILIDPFVFWAHANPIRAQLLYHRLKNWTARTPLDIENQDNDLPGRARELLLPMRIMFQDENLHAHLRAAVVAQTLGEIAYNSASLAARILEALIKAQFTPGEPDEPEHLRLTCKRIAAMANKLIDAENAAAAGKQQPEGAAPDVAPQADKRSISPQRVGGIARQKFNLVLETDKKTRAVYVKWDASAIEALAGRYGLAEVLQEKITSSTSTTSCIGGSEQEN